MGINSWLLGLLVCSSLLFSHHYGCTSSTGNDIKQQPHPRHKWRGPIGNRTITVDSNGSGEFKSVQAAVDAVAQNNRVKVTILIHPGRYREKVLVPASKSFITFQGVGEGPVIEWHDRASDPGPNGQQLRTYRTASVTVLADYFSARNITFKNTAPAPQPGMQGWQAAALRISGDKAYFGGCRFYGAQDTLCDDRGRHYFKGCFIQGSIDFIFGSARSMYKDCHIHSVATRIGSIAAHFRTSPADNTGFAFLNCRVTGSGPLYVGRAMSPFSTVVYSYTYFDDIVATGNPYEYDDGAGHDDRSFSNNKNMTLFLGLYKCWGPGSKGLAATPWAQQLNYDSAHRFLAKSFVNGRHWIAPSDA